MSKYLVKCDVTTFYEIEIEAVGLPASLKVEKALSKPKDATAKTVKLSLKGEGAPVAGSFQIVGRSMGKTPAERIAGSSLPGRIAPWTDLWVTLAAESSAKK